MGTRAWVWGLLGLAQGGLLWACGESDLVPTWLGKTPAQTAVLAFLLLWPVALYQSADAGLSRRSRALLLGTVALWLLSLSFYQALGQQPSTHGAPSVWTSLWDLRFPALAGIGLGSIVLTALWLGWRAPQRRFDYARLFEYSWRNVLMLALAPLLTGVGWLTLFAGAWLLRSIGIESVMDVVSEPAFAWPASGLMMALAWQQGLHRASAVEGLRRFWLGLNAWFLPVTLGFATVWVLALPVTGLQTLFDTRNAAFILLWFTLLSIHFCNAAWQDGRESAPYPAWLSRAVTWVLPSLILVVGIAVAALWMRIAQRGLSVGRIWALYVALLLGLHALGYGASLLPRWRQRGWLASVGATNTGVAVIGLLLLALLLSPLGDARDLAVRHQLHRLESGRIGAAQFDYAGLLVRHGPAGRAAVEALAQRHGDARQQDIARPARAAMDSPAAPRGLPVPSTEQRQQMAAEALPKLRHWPEKARPDPEFLSRFTAPQADWRDRECLRQLPHCLLWQVDLDGDGRDEVLMLAGARPSVLGVYRLEAAGWRYAGAYNLPGQFDFEAMRHLIEQGDVSLRRPWAPEILIDKRPSEFRSQ